jgi:hypothetical protein
MLHGKQVALNRARELAEQTGQSLEVWRLVRGLRQEKLAVVHPSACVATVVLVGCSKKKRAEPAVATLLYDPSPLFRKQMAVARQIARSNRVFIVSAKHGVVSVLKILKPYEHTLCDKTTKQRAEWADSIVMRLEVLMASRFGEDHEGGTERLRSLDVVLMMGASYARPLRTAAPDDWTFTEPLAGMQIGERLRWLNRAIRRAQKGLPKA